MNQSELNELLLGGRIPSLSDEEWNTFPDQVLRRLRSEARPPVRRLSWRLGTVGILSAAAGLAIGFVLWHHFLPADPPEGILKDGQVLQELLARYPGRLQAIIESEKGREVRLSETSGVATSIPIRLEIWDGVTHQVIITFSGQEIQCGGNRVMVLSDLTGRILLVGNGFFWSDGILTEKAKGLQIKAERIRSKAESSKTLL